MEYTTTLQPAAMYLYNLHTEAGDTINGTAYATMDDLLAAVRSVYGAGCDYAERSGAILNADGDLVATFGE